LNTPPLERALSAGGWAFLARTLVGASGFARTLVLARLLSPQDFGAMGTALVVLAAIEAFTGTGFETALLQRRGDVDGLYDSAFTIQLMRGVALAALLWMVAPSAAAFFHGPVLEPVLRAIGVVLILRGLANPAKLRLFRELRYDTLFWWSLPEIAVGLGSAVVLGIVLRNVWALVIPIIASQAVATVVSHILAQRRPRLALDRAGIREVAHYSKWVFATQAVTFLSLQGDNGFVAKALGIGSLGFYQVAFRIAELPVTGFTEVVSQVALPSLSALHGERDRLRSWYLRAQRVVLMVHGAFVALILLFGGPLTRALLGPRWMPIVPALKILVVAMLLRSVVAMAGTLFNAVGEPRLAYRLHAIRLAIMAAAIYPLSRLMGDLEGVAAAVLISLIGATALCLRPLRTTLAPPVPNGRA
jgi:O-antigen/teichoic acid export membrane protein